MAHPSQQSPNIPEAARKALGGKGKKLHTQEITLRRLEKGKVLATHRLADKDGNPPMDGQKSQMEYALEQGELGQHVQDHMGDIPDEDENVG
jgi:hypothetical protein